MHNEVIMNTPQEEWTKEWRIWNWPNIEEWRYQQMETNPVRKDVNVKSTTQAQLWTWRVKLLKELG